MMWREMMCGAGGVGREHGNNLNSTAASLVDRHIVKAVLACIERVGSSAKWPVHEAQSSAQTSVIVEGLKRIKRGQSQIHVNCYCSS